MPTDLVLQGQAVESELAADLAAGLALGADQLTAVIDSYMLLAGPQGNATVLPAVTKFFSSQERLKQLVDLVLSERLDECTASSFNHKTGFDKLVLLSGDNFKLRLHNFHPASVQRPSESIHNHRWPFASSIVSGYFVSKMYAADNKGEVNRRHYNYVKTEGMKERGTCSWREINTHVLNKGATYFMPYEALHSITEIAPQGAKTVMMTGFEAGDRTDVYSLTELETDNVAASCANRGLTSSEVKDILLSI